MEKMKQKMKDWIANEAMPLWTAKGIDREHGGFFENLSIEGEPILDMAKRTMVQARQIYSFRTAMRLGLLDPKDAGRAIAQGAEFMLKACSRADGGFYNAVDRAGRPHVETPDLYAQAFALFALAQAHALGARLPAKERALQLVDYLERQRKVKGGGYTELKGSETLYEANPHMHLFEASLAWVEVDKDPRWRKLADDLLELCLGKFILREDGVTFLSEHFTSSWTPKIDGGRFVWEPGHHYEWAWLLGRYGLLTGTPAPKAARELFETAERHGFWAERKVSYDEVWSDLKPKTRSSRFWPQCERVKAAVLLGETRAADEAMEALFGYLATPLKGTNFDTLKESGEYTPLPYKSSSIYHIIGAMAEYLTGR